MGKSRDTALFPGRGPHSLSSTLSGYLVLPRVVPWLVPGWWALLVALTHPGSHGEEGWAELLGPLLGSGAWSVVEGGPGTCLPRLHSVMGTEQGYFLFGQPVRRRFPCNQEIGASWRGSHQRQRQGLWLVWKA